MRQRKWASAVAVLLLYSGGAAAQMGARMPHHAEILEVARERQALKILFESVREQIVSAAEAMPSRPITTDRRWSICA